MPISAATDEPSSIILAVEAPNARYDPGAKTLAIRNAPDVAKVLDGQHRIAGLEDASIGPFQVIVSIFVDIDIEDQAMVFATITLEQTKVNKSLAYDLYEHTKRPSPHKTAHNIARLLNSEAESPFRGKIKILGVAGDPEETISQAAFVDSLLPYVSGSAATAARDRDDIKRGGLRSLRRATPAELQTLIFRNMFIDQADEDIALTVWNYFAAVQRKWGRYWTEPLRGNVLNRTTGFRALMQFLRYAYLGLAPAADRVPTGDEFDSIFERVRLRGEEMTPQNFEPGSSGQTKLRRMLLAQTGLAEP